MVNSIVSDYSIYSPAPPSSQMEALSIGKKEAGAAQPFGGRRRIGDVDIEVPITRPAHMQDKKGAYLRTGLFTLGKIIDQEIYIMLSLRTSCIRVI